MIRHANNRQRATSLTSRSLCCYLLHERCSACSFRFILQLIPSIASLESEQSIAICVARCTSYQTSPGTARAISTTRPNNDNVSEFPSEGRRKAFSFNLSYVINYVLLFCQHSVMRCGVAPLRNRINALSIDMNLILSNHRVA
jgi:hypothetical protein